MTPGPGSSEPIVGWERDNTTPRLDPAVCPTCKGNDNLVSVETWIVEYGLTVEEDGGFDFNDEINEFPDSAENVEKSPDRMRLRCTDCDQEFTVNVIRKADA